VTGFELSLGQAARAIATAPLLNREALYRRLAVIVSQT
jgi:hypothetical protein